MKTGLKLYFSLSLPSFRWQLVSCWPAPVSLRIEDLLLVADMRLCPLPEHAAALLRLQVQKQGAALFLPWSGRCKAGGILDTLAWPVLQAAP